MKRMILQRKAMDLCDKNGKRVDEKWKDILFLNIMTKVISEVTEGMW